MMRRVVAAMTAVVLAAVGTFLLVAYVRGAEDRALAGERTVDVLVVREPIARGTAAEKLVDLVAAETVPAKVQAAGSVGSLDELKGKVASVDLIPGEQLVSQRFVDPEELRGQAAVDVPAGLLQVTLLLDPQRALGGRIAAGDSVGVVASFADLKTTGGDAAEPEPTTHLLLHKVLVSNVQGAPAPATTAEEAAAAPPGQLFVTLAVDTANAERVVFAAEHGTLWLTNEPADAPEGSTPVQTKDTIYP